jgi:hypothetical protein
MLADFQIFNPSGVAEATVLSKLAWNKQFRRSWRAPQMLDGLCG